MSTSGTLVRYLKGSSMSLTPFVEVNFQVEGIHRWKDCPFDEVAFLREWHRHMFHFRVRIDVKKLDRGIEFIMLKRELREIVLENILLRPREASCETMAQELLDYYLDVHPPYPGQNIEVFVSEDGENGGGVSFVRSLL